MRFLLLSLMLAALPVASRPALFAAPLQIPPAPLAPAQASALAARALAAELRSAQDTSHPMRYRLRKSSPRLTTTKEIVETRDGDVARLMQVFDKPLSQDDEQKEQTRLDALLSDPSLQLHRKRGEDQDTGIVLRLLRMLPNAFLFQYAGPGMGPAGRVEKFTFTPNPNFEPPDIETRALTAMTGELWVDPEQERVVRLDGRLQQDTDLAWGILGKLNKGGAIVIDQAAVGGGQWRIVRFKMVMALRLLFSTRNTDTTEEMTEYAPVPANLDYKAAIAMLRAAPAVSAQGAH